MAPCSGSDDYHCKGQGVIARHVNVYMYHTTFTYLIGARALLGSWLLSDRVLLPITTRLLTSTTVPYPPFKRMQTILSIQADNTDNEQLAGAAEELPSPLTVSGCGAVPDCAVVWPFLGRAEIEAPVSTRKLVPKLRFLRNRRHCWLWATDPDMSATCKNLPSVWFEAEGLLFLGLLGERLPGVDAGLDTGASFSTLITLRGLSTRETMAVGSRGGRPGALDGAERAYSNKPTDANAPIMTDMTADKVFEGPLAFFGSVGLPGALVVDKGREFNNAKV
ncbi:hypothetical protein AAG570_010017 [Ranatra chinensis]|uniref:Peptidase A2 domain-containing protein n=1 Tax=Ranatra chinensis TaxID=642074 RepID=A0ABD0Z9P5_9HEMI